jgi:outer membrane protein assembly factor BamB
MRLQKVIEGHMRVLALGLSMCAGVAGFCGSAKAADWPHWRGPNYDGISSEKDWNATWPQEGPEVLWKHSIGTGFSSMAVRDGRVYAMGNINDKDILYCFDAATGKEIWKKSYSCPLYKKSHEGGPSATPTMDGDAIYTLSKDGDAIRFDIATGEIVWHKNLNKESGFKHPTWYFSSSPLVVDNLVIVNVGAAGVALNKADGSIVWQSGKGVSGYATGVPFTSGGRKCVALAISRDLVAVNAVTGEVLWRYPWKTSYDINAADPIVSGDTVFISSGYNKGCALLKIQGGSVSEIWRNQNMCNHFNSCVLWEGHIYGMDDKTKTLACLDFKTGSVKWSQKGFGKGSLMVAGGKLIILSDKGRLAIAEASANGYKEFSSAQILTGKCWTVPVLANGRIYARSAAGQLVCLDVSN